MNPESDSFKRIVRSLRERVKEISCLYQADEILKKSHDSLDGLMTELLEILPRGWQYPSLCKARITYENRCFQSTGFRETPWTLSADVEIRNRRVGTVQVGYTENPVGDDRELFLDEERTLIRQIADRLAFTLFSIRYHDVFRDWEQIQRCLSEDECGDGRLILDMLRHTDQKLFIRISRKMMNYLCRAGSSKANEIMLNLGKGDNNTDNDVYEESNWPRERIPLYRMLSLSDDIFKLAVELFGDQEMLHMIRRWIIEDQSDSVVKIIDNKQSSLTNVIDAILEYNAKPSEISTPALIRIHVALIRRFFFDRLEFINVAKNYVNLFDFGEFVKKVIYPTGSLGKLGGKSAGIFLASKILEKNLENANMTGAVKVPKTWCIASDGMTGFLHYNTLEDMVEQKYKEIDQVRLEYPQIIQIFKNSYFQPEIINGLSAALDDFGDTPLIVRSSSLLEDSLGTAFSGKYRSLFVANCGTKRERLEELMDAIAEVYASVFSPDPIQYRAEHGFTDFREEMAILIQEVVGNRVGKYFFPNYAGVAFSRNEFRWSPRISRNDGLIRLVPGLGTRAVDRVSEDYPILLAPGQPSLRVNITPDETRRYAPQYIDVINMETRKFETLSISELIAEVGEEWPNIRKTVSIYKDNFIKPPVGLLDLENDETVVTFEGLIKDTPFLKQIHTILKVLEEKMGVPVDIEFASDGENFYLLQCRPQSFSEQEASASIPQDISEDSIIFTAERYVSNGKLPEITHIVYVDPLKYNELSDLSALNAVGRAIGKLNKLLPKKQFILMGPGRWGSRGDIKLGVRVTYSDFSNTAMLVEIARQKGNYIPELSFGTHFFQDLVEASIRYLPLYPDIPRVKFNHSFLTKTENILPKLLPEMAFLSDTLHVIDVPESTGGRILRVLMNADLDQAIAYLSTPVPLELQERHVVKLQETNAEDHWRWRLSMVEEIASKMDPQRFGVRALYVLGSVKNATAEPFSDIDMLVHFCGNEVQRESLVNWLEGWSLCLGELNYLRTGFKIERFLDVHIVTDEDVEKKRGIASKIDAVTDAARPLNMGTNDVSSFCK